MKLYIFLTNTLGGYTGGPSYVRNKKIWLQEHGWEVIAFDSTGHSNVPIQFIELLKYNDNRIEELFYHPSWFNKKTRKNVVRRILDKIKVDFTDIVIESNTVILAEWGEIVSKTINAKHLIYLIEENVRITNINTFKFLLHKYKYQELFSISAKAFQALWGNYMIIENPEINYWNAMSIIKPIDIAVKELDNVNHADYTITYFGRYKNFVPNIIEQVCIFANNYNNKTINFILFGISTLSEVLINRIKNVTNIRLYLFSGKFPIPKRIFEISDVIVATAGCASIAVGENVKTVSYNVETNLPIGVMKYTTVRSSFSDPLIPDTDKALNEILVDILINKIYDKASSLELPERQHDYHYQMSFVNNHKNYYNEVLEINYVENFNRFVQKLLCKLGLVHLSSIIRYNRYK